MGVMLFPSLVLGNSSGEGGTFLVSLSLFSSLLSLSLLSSSSPSFSVSLPLFPFPSSSLFHLFFLSFRLSLPLFPSSFLSLEVFFFEGTTCTVYLRDVRMRLLIVINYTFIGIKRYIFFFLNLGFAHSDVCDLLVHFLAETSDKKINKHTVRHSKTNNILFKITSRGLLIKTLKVLSIPSMK